MTLPPKSYAHKLYTFCEQPVKIKVNLHNTTVNSTEPSLDFARDGQSPPKEGAGSAQRQGIQAQPQVDNNNQSSNSVSDGQPPLKEGAGSAQCQGIQAQPQDNDNDQSLDFARDGQPPLAGSAQRQGIQAQPEDNDNDQSLNSVRDCQPPLKEGAGSAQCQGIQAQPQDDDNDQHPGRQRPSSAKNRVLNLRGNLSFAEGSRSSTGQWINYDQDHLLRICSCAKRPSLGKHCRRWKRDKVMAVFNQKLNDYCIHETLNLNEIVLVYTDGAVQNNRSGWGFQAVYRENIIREGYGGYNHRKNSLEMEAEAVWHVLSWLVSNRTGFFKHAMILMDCKNITDQIKNKLVRRGWSELLNELCLTEDFCLTWMYVPGHCGIPGNEAADNFASLGCKIFNSSSSRDAT